MTPGNPTDENGAPAPGPDYARDFDASKGAMPWCFRNGVEVAKRFDLSGFHMPYLRVVSVHVLNGRPYVQIEAQVRNYLTGEPTHIAFVRDVDRSSEVVHEGELTEDDVKRMVWQACILVLAHELDEALRFDGVRLREPHPGQPFAPYDFRRMDGPPVSVGEVAALRRTAMANVDSANTHPSADKST